MTMSDVDQINLLRTMRELAIERECVDLLMRYGRAQDDMSPEQMCGLFSDDAAMNLVDGPRIEGGPAIEAFWNSFFASPRPSIGRHIFTNVHTHVATEYEASGSAYVAVYRYLPGEPVLSLAPVMIGEARLRYVLTTEGWKISLYELEIVTIDGYVHGRG